MFLEPRLEKVLTDLFGMSVTIQGLQVDPLTGRVEASYVVFQNQPQFAPRPHFEIQGMKFDLNLGALREKQVLIGEIHLKEFVYFIDRISTETGVRNNAKTWYEHIQGRKKKENPNREKDSKKWVIQIDKLRLNRGTFIFRCLDAPPDRSVSSSRPSSLLQCLSETPFPRSPWPEYQSTSHCVP